MTTIDVGAAIASTAIGSSELGEDIAGVLAAVLAACDPVAWVERHVAPAGAGLRLAEHVLAPDPGGVLRVLGIGKAAPAIVAAVLDIAGARVHEALAIGKRGTPMPHARPRLELRCGGHPLPDADSVAAGRAALAIAARTGPSDRLLAIIGGGASALACAPLVPLDELRELGDRLARAGTPIATLNAVRGRLDALKHGGLAHAAGGRALALVLDDIPGGDPHAVGSGPLHGEVPALPPELRLPATPRWTGPPVPHVVIADNEAAVAAALAAGSARGLAAIRGPALHGEARELGPRLAELALACARPFAIVCGGECTVTRRGDGRGGRSMELALAAARVLAGHDRIALAAFATDGDDGSSDAAGAIVDGTTVARARAIDCSLDDALARSDTASALARLGDLLVTGATGTNVCDVVVIVAR